MIIILRFSLTSGPKFIHIHTTIFIIVVASAKRKLNYHLHFQLDFNSIQQAKLILKYSKCTWKSWSYYYFCIYTLCLYIVNTLNLDLLRSIISKFDNFCVYLEKKVFVKYMGKTFNQLYYWPQRWHSWEIGGLCLMKFSSEECFKTCQIIWNILWYFNFLP